MTVMHLVLPLQSHTSAHSAKQCIQVLDDATNDADTLSELIEPGPVLIHIMEDEGVRVPLSVRLFDFGFGFLKRYFALHNCTPLDQALHTVEVSLSGCILEPPFGRVVFEGLPHQVEEVVVLLRHAFRAKSAQTLVHILSGRLIIHTLLRRISVSATREQEGCDLESAVQFDLARPHQQTAVTPLG